MSRERLILKNPTGWFAAGREMAQALDQVSDLSFKLFVYICLNANRRTGKISAVAADLAGRLRKKEGAVSASLVELTSMGVCKVGDYGIEVCDRFWPYEKQSVDGDDGQAEFVRKVRTELMVPACVKSAFIPAEEELAIGLYKRGVSLEILKRAIWLACARKYLAMLNSQTREHITSLGYFIPVVEEVSRTQVPESYWEHVQHKAKQMEKRWLQLSPLSGVPQAQDPTSS